MVEVVGLNPTVSGRAARGGTSDDEATEVDLPWARRPSFGSALVLVTLAGLALRVAYVLITRDHPLFADSLGYHFRAQDLADGNGFVLPARQVLGLDVENPPDAGIPPGWSVVLSVPTMLGLRSVLSQQLFACLIGAATIAVAGLAGRRAVGPRAGLITAGIVAVYPNTWLYERELLSEPLTMLLVATMIWGAYSFRQAPSTRGALLLGIALGALAITRAEQVLLTPLLVVPLILSARRVAMSTRVAWLALAGIASLLFVAPWTAYNWDRFEQPVLLSTGFGQVLRAGNCDRTYHGELLGYTRLNFTDTGAADGCSITDAEFASDPSEIDDQLRRAAVDYMRDNAERVPVVAAARIGRTFNLFRPFQQVHFEAERESPLPVLRSALFSYWLLAPLAVLGVLVTRRRGIPVYPLVVFFIVVVATVAMTIGAVRYRAPAEVPLAMLAAVGIEHLLARGGARGTVD